jgi:hypothetical protein
MLMMPVSPKSGLAGAPPVRRPSTLYPARTPEHAVSSPHPQPAPGRLSATIGR